MAKKSLRERLAEHRKKLDEVVGKHVKDLTPKEKGILMKRLARPIIEQGLGSAFLSILEGAGEAGLRIEVGEPCEHTHYVEIVTAHMFHDMRVQDVRGGIYDVREVRWCPDCGELFTKKESDEKYHPLEVCSVCHRIGHGSCGTVSG